MLRAFALVLAMVGVGGPVMADDTLPQDSRLVTGTLSNGVSYLVLEHANPPERVSVYLHVDSGSLNETDRQRGIAHYLEHMAFNGSENFSPGSVIQFFQEMGLTFGQHQNAFTSFDQTTYTLDLPDNKVQTLDKGLIFFSDVAFRLSLLPEEIDSERQIILEEKRTRAGAQQRIQNELFERIAPGSIFGQRLPIGTEETIQGVKREDFLDYYNHWYTPENMTVIIVGDMDSEVVVERIKAAFGGAEGAPKPQHQDVGIKPYEASFAIVIDDEELTQASVSVLRISEYGEPVTTRDTMRNDLIQRLATMVFNRRLGAKVASGEVSFLNGFAFAADLFKALFVSQIQVQGEPENWRDMLGDMAIEVQRVRLHGVSEQELDDGRVMVLSGAEQAVKVELTLPAQALIRRYNSAIANGQTIVSAEDQLELVKDLLPGISVSEVSTRLKELLDPSAVAFVLELPSSEAVPSEDELLAFGRKAFEVEPEAEAQEDRPETLMSSTPKPGEYVEVSKHEPTGVWSAWLSNGVRVHYRYMDEREHQATISITLAGGELLEGADNRGITRAAAIAFDRRATSTLSSTNIRDLMTGKKAQVGGSSGEDTLNLRIAGNPDDFETGLQLAHLLLTDPVVEEAGFTQWQQEQIQMVEGRDMNPSQAFSEVLINTIMPENEHRNRPLEIEDVQRLTRSQAQDWLLANVRTAPMEVTIVGDIQQDQALELVRVYLGSLPSRERISDTTFDSLRVIQRPVGPLTSEKEISTQTPVAIAFVGFFGADARDVEDARLLSMATRILQTRLIEQVREGAQLMYSPRIQSSPSLVYPGYGLVYAAGPTDPAKTGELVTMLSGIMEEFKKSGPSQEELDVAKGQVANDLAERMIQPRFWSGQISEMTYRGRQLDDIANAPEQYESFTVEQIQDAFARYFTPESSVRVVVKPAANEDSD